MSIQLFYSILFMIIPLYNVLIDHTEDFINENENNNNENNNNNSNEELSINLAAKNCQKKLLEYYNKTNDTCIIVIILDPRLKMEYYNDDEMWNKNQRKEICEN